jgi:hypothetical protein
MTLAATSLRSDFDPAVASACKSELVKQKLKFMKALGRGGTIEDMLIMRTDQIHIVKMVNPTTFLHLAVDKKSSNTAIVRNAVNEHMATIS